MIEQLRFVNYDQECNHAQMKQELAVGHGNEMGGGEASAIFLGSQIGRDHERCCVPVVKRKRGRPTKKHCTKKRKRLDAWNASVANNKPCCPPSLQGIFVKSGLHMKALGKAWKKLKTSAARPLRGHGHSSEAEH